jgi:hypothetical protein
VPELGHSNEQTTDSHAHSFAQNVWVRRLEVNESSRLFPRVLAEPF